MRVRMSGCTVGGSDHFNRILKCSTKKSGSHESWNPSIAIVYLKASNIYILYSRFN